jgi:hypothetical protein
MKVKGKIISIGEAQTFDSGAKKLEFQIDTGEQYDNIISFDLFKGVEHVTHLDKFLEFNKVGDSVEVEFNIKCREHKGKYYTNLSMWRCEKMNGQGNEPFEGMPNPVGEEESGLPF